MATMETLIERLAKKKEASPKPAELVLLPMASKEHEGACGDGCGCGEDESGGCCGG